MNQNPHDHLEMFPSGQLSSVVGGIAQRDPRDGGTPTALPPLHPSKPFRQSNESKCGVRKGKFLGGNAPVSLTNGGTVIAPIAVCPWIPKLVNK